MGRRGAWALHLMLALTLAEWLVQLGASQACSSLTLLSHSLHTFVTLLGLGTLQATMKLGEAPARRNTYGWRRVRPLGALVQGVLLSGLGVSVLAKAAEGVLQPRPVRRPGVLLGVTFASLLVDLGTFYLFKGAQQWGCPAALDCEQEGKEPPDKVRINGLGRGEEAQKPCVAGEELSPSWRSASPRVLGDSVVSALALFNAVAYYTSWPACAEGQCGGPAGLDEPCWWLHLDPVLCLGLIARALWAACPQVKESGLLLLQAVPGGLDLGRLRTRLLGLDGVTAVHELHVWRLAGRRLVATAHVKCREAGVARRASAFLRGEGISGATVQPEVGGGGAAWGSECELACRAECSTRLCCSGDESSRHGRTGPHSMLSPCISTECETAV
ncbi:proton-coupled zinc antiporter SLC30A1-like [Narcine bancroftii]|uniref:proton-coupled zinc antiporter SLC30A1-like n=1 Tax=Narcine bancroftii TaxID=1343680 RepID=UPI003831F690